MSIYDKLYDWQKIIFEEFKNRNRLGLFLDMGLGKTPLSLAFAEYHNCNKIIVISLKSKIIETIEDEGSFEFWINKMDIEYNIIKKSSKKINYNHNNVLMINYEALYKRGEVISKRKKKLSLSDFLEDFINTLKSDDKVCLIIDESHKMKSDDSKQTKAINVLKREILIKTRNLYCYLLTGTPFTSGYIDLYNQLNFLGCEISKSYFYDNFCIRGNLPGLLGWQQPIIGYKNVDYLLKIVDKYSISLLTDFVIDLPEQIITYIKLPTTKDFKLFTKKKYNRKELEEIIIERNITPDKEFKKLLLSNEKTIPNPFYRNIDYPNEDYIAETISQFMLRAKELSVGFQGNAEKSIWYDNSRLKKLEEFLENNRDNYLLFYNYTPELYEIFSICEKLNYNIDVYCGEVKSLHFYNKYKKQTEEEKFNNKNNIILANFASGSTGMNWQAYNKCIIFSLPNYKDYSQGIKRIHRYGQKNTVFYYIFYQTNFVDKNILKSLNDKKDYNLLLFEHDLNEDNETRD